MASFTSAAGRRPLLIRRLVLRLSAGVSSSAATSSAGVSSFPDSRLPTKRGPFKTLAEGSSPSPTGRFAVELAARRPANANSREPKSDPGASKEPFLSTVILSYGSSRMLDRAIAVFEDVPRLSAAPPTAISFNALLSAAIRAGEHRKVPDLFSQLSQKHSVSPDELSYGILVKSLCISGEIDGVFEVLKEMQEKGIEVTNVTYTTVVSALYREQKPDLAEGLWKEMISRGRRLDLTSFNVKIKHQALNGEVEKVLDSMLELKAAGLKPDRITYNYMMSCYSMNGRFEDVKKVYKELKSNGCVPNSTTFNIMLNYLCENGDFDAGFGVLMESLKHDKIPDFLTLKSLVVGLTRNSEIKKAKMVIRAGKQKFPANMMGGWKKVEKELGLHVRNSSESVETDES